MKKLTANQLASMLMTKKQRALRKKHGTPAEFAVACYQAVPGELSMDEARDAVEEYNHKWEQAGRRFPIIYGRWTCTPKVSALLKKLDARKEPPTP